MAIDDDDFNPSYFTICLLSECEGQEDFLDKIKEISNIGVSESFDNRIYDIDPDDITESSVTIADQPPRTAVPGEHSALFASFREDDGETMLHVHADFNNERFDEMAKIFAQILAIINEAQAQMFSVDVELKVPFDRLNLPLSDEGGENVVGIRLKSNGGNYIIQKDDDETSIRFVLTDDHEMDVDQEDFIQSKLLNIRTYISGLENE